MRSRHYRQNAQNCLRLANSSTDPSTKAMLLGMARAWNTLAYRSASNFRHHKYQANRHFIYENKNLKQLV
jgi:hypothetical protein